jgi:hypothetical protein
MSYLMGAESKKTEYNDETEWYAVDRLTPNDNPKQPSKVLRMRVCDRVTANKMVAEFAAGVNVTDYEGNLAEPGEFGEAPFYRVTLVSQDMARDWFEGCKVDGCQGWMLTLSEAAEKRGMSKQSMWERIKRGRMTAEIVGGTWRVLDATLALWTPEK